MAQIRRLAVVGVSSLAALTMVASTASAATTTIRRGTAAAAAYSGNIQASLLGNATVSSSIGSGSCSQSTMLGSVQSNGTSLSISSATFTGAGGGSCSGSVSSTITAQNLPWSGGNVTFTSAATSGGPNGTVTISNFRVKAVVNIFGGITCIFGGNLTANAYNPDNTSRPDTSVSEAQAYVNGATVTKVSSGSSFLCPSTATVTANYKLQGETTAGSGVYNQTLYITS
jgi:hypothetical protein